MATQADIPEVILQKKLEVEHTNLTTVQFEEAVNETFLVEVKKYESVLNEYPETQQSQAESENKQVACSSQVEITDNLVNGNSGTSEGGIFLASLSGSAISSKEASGQEDFQVDEHTWSEVEISETAKHLEKGHQFEAVKETAREDEVAEEKNGEADQVDKNLGQNEGVILNQKDSVDEGLGSTEKEIKDSEKDDKEGEMEESQSQLSSKEIPRIPEVTLDHKIVQSVAVTCPEEENMDNKSSTEAILLEKKYTEERSLEETKEEGECVDLVTDGGGSEEICASENKGNEDEKKQITHDIVGNSTLSTASLNREESQNHKTGESVNDEIERVIVTDEPGDQEAGIAEKEKHEEFAGPVSSEDANDLSRQENDKVPIKNEVQDKDSSVTLFVLKAEDECSQGKDNPEILKESSKIELDYIAKEEPIEVTKQTEILEETTKVKGTASGDINGHENSEQKLGFSSRKPDEEIHGKDEGLDTTEAAENTEASSLVAAEDINSIKLIQAEELTEAEPTKHEDHPDDNLLQQNETEEKFQTHFNVVSEETKSVALRDATTVTSIKEEGEIKSLEESLKESEETSNLPLTHSDKKAESTEAEFPNNDANNSNATHLLVEQAEVKGEKIDEVSNLESRENDQASDEALAKEEKHAEAESEGYQITEKTFFTSTEEIPPTETIVNAHENTEEPVNRGANSKESLESQDAGEHELEEIKVEAEVTNLDVQKFTSSQESEESSPLDKNTVGKIPKEEASKPTSEDESHKQEGIAAGFDKEQIGERDVVFSTPETIKEGTSKSFEDNIKDAEKLSEAEIPTEIIKEGDINDLTLEKIQEDATNVLKDHGHGAEKSKEEVLEELETVGAGENIPYETKNIEKIVDTPPVEQEEVQHEESKYLDRTEASIEESKVEIAVEEALKSRGEDEVHIQECTEENFNKEQTIEKDVTFSAPESVQEATSGGCHDNIKAVENLNEEESTVVITKEDKLDDLSPENTQENATKTLEDRENEAEKSKEKIVEELETARAGESISCETIKDVESFVDASSVEQGVNDQDQGPIKAPTEENKVEIVEEEALKSKHEEESHKQEAESNKEQIIEEGVTFSAAESTQEETSKTSQENVKYAEKLNEEESTVERTPENKQGDEIQLNKHENEAEKCIEEVVQESDTSGPTESISFETNKDGEKIVDASSIKQEEGQQEEGKYQDPNKASIEKNKVETPKEEGPKSKDEDESHEQESTVADFGKEQIVDKDTFSTLESIQEETSKSSQDNVNDAEKINEEHPAETTNEGNINNLSPKNIQGDAFEVLKDHENEVEKSKEEVLEELETAGLGESIPCKTNKDVERFEDASSVKQDEGQQKQGRYLDPIRASTEVNKPEDEASKSRGDNESHRQESTEADFNKEQIVEREVTLCTPESIQEETSKASQVDVKDAERNGEESTTERTKVGETNDLSGENIQGDTFETLKDHENGEEKLKEEVVEELEAAKVNESISCETNKDVESYVDASLMKQEEGRQEEGKYTDPNGTSIEENKVEIPEKEALKLRGEDESHRQESTEEDSKKEHIVVEEATFSTPESIQHETSESSQDNRKDAEKINEESTIEITKEGNTNDLSQENIQEDAVEALKEEHENELGKSKEEVARELETIRPSESIPFETKKVVEKTVDTSSVRQEEALTEEENKFEDKFSTEVVKNFDDNEVTATERGIELASKGKEDQQQVMQEDKPEEKLEDLLHVTTEAIETEKSSEMDRELTCVEGKRSIQDLNETSETKKEEEKSKNMDTDDTEIEIPKELETAEATESCPCDINEDAESSIDDWSVKQEEGPKEEVKYIDQVEALTEENKLVGTIAAGVVKDDEENKVLDASSRDEEDQQQATQKDEPEEKLDNLTSVTPEEIETETTTENARSITSLEVEGTSQNLEDIFETEETKYTEDTNDLEKEISKELETAGSDESIPCKTNEDIEHSVDSSSINQEDQIQQEEAKYLHQVDASIEENKFVDTYSTEVVKEDDDNKVEVAEKRIEVASNDGEDQQQSTQKDEPGEKLEVTLVETGTEPSSEIAREITSAEVEGTAHNIEKAVETENEEEKRENTDGTNEPEKEIHKELETTGACKSVPCKTNEDAESSFDASSVKQEESQKEEVKYIDQVQASIGENKLEETSTAELVKADDDNKVSNVASKAEEDQQQATRKDKPDEKLENLHHVTLEETEIETSAENATNITCVEAEIIAQNLEETLEKEKIEHVDSITDSEKEITQELETVGTDESIPCKTNEDVEGSVVTLSVKQDGQHEEDKELDQIDALKEENKVEDSSSAEAGKQDDDSKFEVTKKETEEDQQPAMPKDEPEQKLEDLLQATPKETEAEISSEDAINITCVEEEGTVLDVEENSEIGNKEENMKNADDANDSEKEVLENTNAGQETREEVLRKIVGESSKEVEKEEDKSSGSKEQTEVSVLIADIKPESLEDRAKPNEELYTTITTEALEEEKLAEEETQEREVAVHCGTDSGSAGILAEELSVKEAKPDDKEVQSYEVSLSEKGSENNQVESESVLTENLSGETGLKKGELDNEEQLKSSDVAPEDGLKSIAGSVLTDVVSEKTLLKEVQRDVEERIESSDDALMDKGLESNGDPVSSEILSEETFLKEAKPDDEQKIKNPDAVSEEKGVSSSAGVGSEPDSVSAESSYDASLVKKEETQQEEVKYIDQARASMEENKFEETFTTEVVKVDDDNKVSTVASRGEEVQTQATQKDKPDEKLENLLHVTPEETETETSTENATNITFVGVEGIAPNLEETSEQDKSEHVHGADDSAKEIPRELETARADESTPCKTNEDVERSVANLLVKQHGQCDEEKELDQIDALKGENKVEDSSSTEVVKQDDENKVEVTKREIEEDQQPAMPKDEPKQKLEDLLQVTPNETKAGTSSEDAIDITCMEGEGTIQDVEETSEVEKKEENVKNKDDANEIEKEVIESASAGHETRAEVSRDIVGESPKEVEKEDDKSSESKEQNEVADFIEEINPKSLEDSAKPNEDLYAKTNTEAPEEEKLAEEETQEKGPAVHDGSAGILVEETSMTETKPDEEDVRSYDIAPEDKGLISIAGSLSTGIVSEETRTMKAKTDVEEKIRSSDDALEEKGLESSGDPISTEIVLETTSESQETREISREIGEESSKEVEKEEDKSSESREQNEVAALIEDKKLESLQEGAKQNEEFHATTTTEAPREEKLVEEETEDKEPVIHDGTDSGSARILVEETSVSEAKPDEEEVRSYDIAPEDKGLTSIASSVSTEIVSEETCTKESKIDVEEKIRSSDDALEEKRPESNGDPISTKIVLETTSESQETREVSREIVEESSKEVEKEEDKSSESREQNEVATLMKDIQPESLQESAKQNEESYATTTTEAPKEEKLAKEETQEKEPAVHDGAESESAGILTEETSIKEAKPDDKEEVRSYEVSLEDKGSENNQVQSESVLTEKLKGEVELKEDEPDNEEQLKSCDISPEDEGLTSIAGSVSTEIASEKTFLKEVKSDDEEKIKSSDNALEEKDLKSRSDPISTEIVLETTNAGLETKEEVSRDIVEESLKEVEKEEQKSFESKEQNEAVALIVDIKPESFEHGAKPNENLHSKTTTEAPEEEKLAEEETQEKEPAIHDGTDSGSAGTLAEETSVKEAKQDVKEEVKSYGISLREKVLENIQVQPESVLTENLSEETGLKEGEPDKEVQLKSCDIAPEDGLKSIVGSASTEIVSEKTLLKEVKTDDEEKIKSSDNAFEEKDLESSDYPVSTETVSEETRLKKAKPDDEEQIKNSDAVSEEKGVSSSTDVGSESDFVSTGISNEEARVKEAEPDDEEQVKICDIATEERGLERSIDVDAQSDFASTKIKSEEIGSKEAKPEAVEQVKSYDVAAEEKSIEEQSDSISNEIVCAETCAEEDKQDRGDQENDPVIAPEEKSLASSRDAEIVSEETAAIANEEMRLKEGKEDKEEHVQNSGFPLEKESLVSDADVTAKSASASAESVSEETGVKETKQDQDEPVSSANIVFEEKNLESSLDTKTVSEETSLEEVKPDDEEQVKGSAPERESLVTYVDAKVQSDFVSAGKESEERSLEEDKPKNEDKVRSPDIALEEVSLVGEETGGKEAESDNEEEVRNSDIAPEEKGGMSNVFSEVQQNENVKSEEIEENKGQEGTSECEEKIDEETKGETPIAGTENREQDTVAETPLNDSSEDNLQDSSAVPSTEHEPVITEATERSDETTAIDKTECENANLRITEPTKEEELLQEKYDSKLESHTEKEIVNEEIQKQREEDLSAPPEITSKDAIPTEVHDGVKKAVEKESSIEQVTDNEIDLKETRTESIVDERVYEEKDSVATVTEVVKATDADEHISCMNLQTKETSTEENEEFAPTAPEDEKINDEGSLKPVDDRIASREEGEIEEEVDNSCYNNDTTTAREETPVTTSGEAQTVETDSEERKLVPAQKVEERSFDLNQVDQQEAESETIVEESHAVTEAKETELASDTEDVNAAKPIPAVEKLETDEIKDEIKEESECQGVKATNQGEITSEQAEKIESSAPLLEKEEERQGKEETEEDVKTAHETVSKDEVNVGVSTGQVQELETSQVVKQTQDSLVEEKAEETKLKEETEEEITVSAIADETIEDHSVLAATSKREEQESENACGSSATKTAEEACVQEEEPREIKFTDETQAETKDASITVSESDSQSIAIVAKEDEKITCETVTDSATEVQLLEQSYVLLPTEEENGITTAAKEKIEEKTTEETCSKKEVLGGDKIEDITEASERVSKEKSPDIEIEKDQIEQEHETAATVKKIEEEETKEEPKLSNDKTLEDSSAAKTVEEVDDAPEGLNEVSKVEPQESERSTRDADSPSVVEASNLHIEKREIGSDFVSEKVESPEALTSIEEVEIIENHLKVASTDLRNEEPQCETTIQAEKTTEREILAQEEPSTEISQEKGVLDVEKVHGIVQEIKRPEESSHATCKEQTPKEAEGKESLEKGITTSNKDAPPKLTDPVEEASQRAEPNDTKPKNDNVSVNREIFETEIKKEEYCQGGNETGGSKTETKTAVISLSDLMQSSKEGTDQVAEHSTEDREETRKNGTEVEKTKTDEERDEEEEEEDDEHEHEHEEAHHPDAPILVQTSKDIDPKVGRKKSHGLFSGVGSKVKHSISKVKKAITGKSSHSKTQPST